MIDYMKVLINAFSARSGGGQTYLVNLLQYLDEIPEAEVNILAPDSLTLPSHPRLKRIRVKWPTSNPLLRAVWERLFLKHLLRKIDADILFCPGGLINTATPKKCKSVTMFRSMLPFDHRQRKKYGYGLKRIRNWLLEKTMLNTMQRADLVIFISHYARQVIQKRIGENMNNAITIPHGLDGHFKYAETHELLRPVWLPKHEYILYVSIMDVYKNQLEVVRGYHLLKQRRETNEKLVLAGYDATTYGKLVRCEIERLGLRDDVIIAGNITHRDLPAVYRYAKINLFASECENCPNILLEALGAGRPLLVSNYPPMPEFGGDAVVYFNPSDPNDLADRLKEVLEDPSLQQNLAERAGQRSRQYDWRETARRTWQAIKEIHLRGEVAIR